MDSESLKATTTSAGVSENLAAEARRKRRAIVKSWWPRARLAGEILYHQVNKAGTFTQASALTYKTLFSLLPIFVLSLLVLSAISAGGGQNALDVAVKRVMFEQLSLDKLQLTDSDGRPMTNSRGEPITLAGFAERMIERAKKSVNAQATGLVAFGILVYGALSLMIVIESTFNLIYGGAKPRSWPQRVMLYWCVLTLGPLGVAGSIVLGDLAYGKASNYVSSGAIAWTLMPLQVASGLAVSFVLVTLMYRLIPGGYVKWKSALVGGAVGALLWELCKWGFGMYVNWTMHRANWYGPIVLLPLFMLWIYLTWSSILLGLHVAYMHQCYPMLKRQFFFNRMGAVVLSDLRWILSLGVLVYQRFKEGKPTHAHDAAELLLLPHEVAEQLLEGLHTAGIVQATRGNGFTLARPAERISALDLLMVGRGLCQVPPELARENPALASWPQSAALRELDAVEVAWAKSRTLPELAGETSSDGATASP